MIEKIMGKFSLVGFILFLIIGVKKSLKNSFLISEISWLIVGLILQAEIHSGHLIYLFYQVYIHRKVITLTNISEVTAQNSFQGCIFVFSFFFFPSPFLPSLFHSSPLSYLSESFHIQFGNVFLCLE